MNILSPPPLLSSMTVLGSFVYNKSDIVISEGQLAKAMVEVGFYSTLSAIVIFLSVMLFFYAVLMPLFWMLEKRRMALGFKWFKIYTLGFSNTDDMTAKHLGVLVAIMIFVSFFVASGAIIDFARDILVSLLGRLPL